MTDEVEGIVSQERWSDHFERCGMSRASLIRDAKKIDISRFVKKSVDFSIAIKSKKLDELYEKYRMALEKGNVTLIATARKKLLEHKCRLGANIGA